MDLTHVITTIPVEYVHKAVKSAKRLAYLIAAIGAVVSYGTQVELVTSWGIGGAFAYGIPATIDLLVICAAIALNVPGLPPRWRKEIGVIMVVGLTVSITANMIAGHNWGAKIAHAWPVIAYMLAEFIANRLKTYLATLLTAKAKAEVVASQPVETPAPVQATIESKPTAPVASKPGSAKSKILELASVKPPLSPEDIAEKVGTKPGWVKHVIKTTAMEDAAS